MYGVYSSMYCSVSVQYVEYIHSVCGVYSSMYCSVPVQYVEYIHSVWCVQQYVL